MRKWNAVLTAVILVLFLLHGILGGFQLLGVGSTALKRLARGCMALILVHGLLGCKLTVDTLRVRHKTGVGYGRENRLFWLRRVSGLAVMAFLVLHLLAFHGTGAGGSYRLPWFTAGKLAAQLLLAASVGVHVLSNVRPAMMGFGAGGRRRLAADVWLVLAAVLLFMGMAFVVYYLRWNVW